MVAGGVGTGVTVGVGCGIQPVTGTVGVVIAVTVTGGTMTGGLLAGPKSVR
jgi:hypothetical protein